MNRKLRQRWRTIREADFLSPPSLLRCAVLLCAAYLLAQFCGLREFTSILNGTVGSVGLGWEQSALFGLLFIVLYLGFILAVPVLLLAAAILTIWRLLSSFRKRSHLT